MNIYHPDLYEPSVESTYLGMCRDLVERGDRINTGTWQSQRDTPMAKTRELLNVQIRLPIAFTPGAWQSYVHPNLPWAEEHFQERVSGTPYNPPPSHVRWPYNQDGNKDHMHGEVFSHSYPERLWPRWAPMESGPLVGGYGFGSHLGQRPQHGIRYRYGDLDDLVTLLIRDPYTRQGYVPLWFPEDLSAAVEKQRVPCTLGYHFILRSNRLHCFYPMRSLDLLRYFKDDAYMAGRLCQWLIQQCRSRRTDDDNSVWHDVQPGLLTLQVVSLHCFEGDVSIINHMLAKKQRQEPAYEVIR